MDDLLTGTEIALIGAGLIEAYTVEHAPEVSPVGDDGAVEFSLRTSATMGNSRTLYILSSYRLAVLAGIRKKHAIRQGKAVFRRMDAWWSFTLVGRA